LPQIRLELPQRHAAQQQIIDEARRYNVACCGRRFGKTSLGLDLCIDPMLDGLPVGWFSPTYKTLSESWREVQTTLRTLTASANSSEHRLELITGGVLEMWSLQDHDAGRSRKYRRVIVDECAVVRDLMETWTNAIWPTLIDLRGDAYFLSTPKGRNDFQRLWDLGQNAAEPEWASWRFPSSANPYLPAGEIEAMRRRMPARAFEQEIEARFIDEVSGALWKYALIDANRVSAAPELARIVVAIDPAVSANPDSDETGIIAAGVDAGGQNGYVLADASGVYSPDAWARKAVELYHSLGADHIIAESNQGGDMVQFTLRTVDPTVPVRLVHASRGKVTRAEPVVALDEQARIHHVGIFAQLEMQMTTWSPVDDKDSPDRVDARVWALTELMLGDSRQWTIEEIEAWGRDDIEAIKAMRSR
jgi:phage terminase large subunit-like protein